MPTDPAPTSVGLMLADGHRAWRLAQARRDGRPLAAHPRALAPRGAPPHARAPMGAPLRAQAPMGAPPHARVPMGAPPRVRLLKGAPPRARAPMGVRHPAPTSTADPPLAGLIADPLLGAASRATAAHEAAGAIGGFPLGLVSALD